MLLALTKNIRKKEEKNLDEYVGLLTPLKDPFNIFIKLSDLVTPGIDQLRFFVYSAGSKRILFWGEYDLPTEQINIAQMCKYGTPGAKISEIMENMNTKKFTYFANTVKNRIVDIMLEHKGIKDPEGLYKIYKYKLTLDSGKIKPEEVNPIILEKIDEKFNEFLRKLGLIERDLISLEEQELKIIEDNFNKEAEDYVDQYEKNMNRIDLNDKLVTMAKVRPLDQDEMNVLHFFSRKIYDLVKFGTLYSDKIYNNLPTCPLRKDCENDQNHENENELCGLWNFGEDDEEVARDIDELFRMKDKKENLY